MRRQQLVPGLVALWVVVVVGCGSSGSTNRDEKELQEIGLAYQKYQAEYKKPPPTPLDLALYLPEPTTKKLMEGKYIVLSNISVTDVVEGKVPKANRTVLAYEKDAPDKGGPVLMMNMTVLNVSAEQFKTLPQAVPKK